VVAVAGPGGGMGVRGWLRRPPLAGRALDRALERRAELSESALRQWVEEQLADRLDRAATLPFYRAGARPFPARGESLVRLGGLPLLPRSALAADPRAFLDPRWPPALLRSARSSGTSGQPLTVLRDPLSMLLEEAFLRRQLRAFGCNEPGVVLAVRAEGPRDPHAPPIGRSATRDEWVVAASRLDDDTVRAVARFGEERGVTLVRGYPSALLELARRADLLGLRAQLARWPLQVVHVSSETLSEGAQATLEAAFVAPVAEQYGQAERALLIQSCPRGARHLVLDYGWGEVVDGEWVGTPLFGAQLLLRYRTGDRAGELDGGATSGPADRCGCGWPFPIVGRVLGRQDAVVVLPDGRRVGRLGPALRAVDGVAWVQVEQDALGGLRVRFGAAPGVDPDAVGDRLGRAIAELIRSPETRITLAPGEPAVRDASGKVRAVLAASDDQAR
jgi:phenylacetate-CoA ligase